jgi:hypothetical protein
MLSLGIKAVIIFITPVEGMGALMADNSINILFTYN